MIEICAISIIFVLAACVSALYYPREWLLVSAKPGSETYFMAFAHVLLLIQTAFALFLLFGLAGLAMGIKTSWWYLWQFLYLPCVPIVSFTCPVLNLVALIWGIVGFLWLNHSLRDFAVVVMLVLTLMLNIGLIYLLETP